ncbi:hypothetical protein JXR01_03230 [Candidatus Kaiserbacteria bacterium]|nr:MAG: hypothetical protein JXR01_03230 [Candidatus Kaiserbacteria bacterium]
MKIDKKSIAVGMLALGLVTTAGAGVTSAAENGGFGGERKGGHAEVAAQLLGVTVDDFKNRIQNGENPRDILEAAGISKEDVRAAHDVRKQERIAQAIADGRITQEEADERAAKQAERKAHREEARNAIESNDYNAWVTASVGTPMEGKVDAAGFAKMVEAHNLREAGDHEEAREIMKGLGFEKPHKKHGAFKEK